jgi:hypothetical protein
LQVNEPVPLQIVGRFDAPSFDARTLNQLLSDGSAILDWQVALGKAITRSETARAPCLRRMRCLWMRPMSTSESIARAALLAQTGRACRW